MHSFLSILHLLDNPVPYLHYIHVQDQTASIINWYHTAWQSCGDIFSMWLRQLDTNIISICKYMCQYRRYISNLFPTNKQKRQRHDAKKYIGFTCKFENIKTASSSFKTQQKISLWSCYISIATCKFAENFLPKNQSTRICRMPPHPNLLAAYNTLHLQYLGPSERP